MHGCRNWRNVCGMSGELSVGEFWSSPRSPLPPPPSPSTSSPSSSSSSSSSIMNFIAGCLAAEKYKKNVIIQTICPLFVSTNMTNLMKTTFFIPTAKVFAKSALGMFGVEQQTTGYFRHDLKEYLYNF
ncbi:uncharacterized protein DC041_0002861 [Schistosoma bovis]|uniref:Uncharacterized protein n=1 Tax=Schistosoma bovis TaxID=6184 RepID=A0A430Q064_SCHBO|nr:uncharacterized protein DC041_0002861 [Schistosoma bovis]